MNQKTLHDLGGGGINIIPADLDEFYKSEEQIDLEGFIEEMGEAINQASISIYRVPVNPRTGLAMKRQMPFLFSCGVEEYNYTQLCELIRDKFGTGIYKIMIRDGKNILRRNRNISVEAAASDEIKPSNDMGGFLTEFNNALATQQDRMEGLMQQNKQPGIFDNPQVMAVLITGAFGLLGKMFENNNAQIQPIKTPLESMTEMVMMRELVEKFQGDGNGNNNFWGALTSLSSSIGPVLMGAMEDAKKSGAVNDAGVIQTQPAAIAAPAPTSEPLEDTETMQYKEMKENLDFLLIQAQAKIDADEVVSFILARMPEDQDAFDDAANKLESFLEQPSCIKQCAVIRPAIKDHLEWFETWRVAMLAKLTDLSEDADSSKTGDGATITEIVPDATTDGLDGDESPSEKPITGDT